MGTTDILNADRIEEISVSHRLCLSLCDAAAGILCSSPYKYSSSLMDPVPAVCCRVMDT